MDRVKPLTSFHVDKKGRGNGAVQTLFKGTCGKNKNDKPNYRCLTIETMQMKELHKHDGIRNTFKGGGVFQMPKNRDKLHLTGSSASPINLP